MAFVTETFTAANGTDVDSLTGWDEHPLKTSGAFTIQTNRAYPSVADPLVYNTGTPASADYDVTATIRVVSLPSGVKVGVCGRMDTTVDTRYEVQYRQQDLRWRLTRVVNGSALEIGSFTQTLTVGNDYVCKLEMIGTVVNVYIDTVLRIAVDDSTAPITAKGKAGMAAAGNAVTTTTGLHFDSITATDASAPADTGTYVGVGAAATVTATADVSPALPAGLATDDLMVAVAFEKGSAGGFTMNTAGWTQIAALAGSGKSRVWTKFYVSGDTTPSININSASSGGIAQVAAFRGIDKTTTVDAIGTVASGASTTDIGPITGLTPSVAGALVVVVGGRHADWTSVATLTGDSLTWAEIAEADSTTSPTIGLVWDYAIFPGAPTAVTSKTFTVTGGAGNWQGFMLAFRPATTVPAPTTNPTKVKIAGVFVTKVMKRKASGTFATKPMKAMSDHPPPPPWEGHDPIYTLTPVTSTNTAGALTYTPGTAPSSQFIFPAQGVNSARPLSYVAHPDPDPGPSGIRVMLWTNVGNVVDATEADLTTMKSYGVDGFHMTLGRAPGWGGAEATYAADLARAQTFANTHPQFKCTVAVTMANYIRNWTPMEHWDDDANWTNVTLPNIQRLGHAIDDSALAGLGLDGEDYTSNATRGPPAKPCSSGWRGDEFAVGGSSPAYRAQVKARAKSIADTLTAITGPTDIYEYYLYLSGGLKQFITKANYDEWVSEDWIDGITANSQVTFRHIDAIYYKPGGKGSFPSWDAAYAYDKANYDGNPKLRKSNSFHEPFVWITEGPKTIAARAAGLPTGQIGDRMYSIPEITLQLQAARRNTEGGEFSLFGYGGFLPTSKYASIAPALQSAST